MPPAAPLEVMSASSTLIIGTAAVGSWWPTRRGFSAGDDQVRVRFGVSAVAHGDTGMQTGAEAVGATMGFRVVRPP